MNRTLIFYALLAATMTHASEIPAPCGDALHSPYGGTVIKTRNDQTKIYRVSMEEGKILYFKETFRGGSGERAVFDDLQSAVLATEAAKRLGLKKYVADIGWRDSLNLTVDGKSIHTRAGALQAEMPAIITPIDEFAIRYPGKPLTARGLQKVLNSGEWPRLYANWKIFWSIFMQVDLNIANLAHSGGQLALFDLGDALNLPGVRRQMGIRSAMEEFHFNLPNQSWDRIEHRPDFRQADPEFKNFAQVVANSSNEELAAILGKNLTDLLGHPRGLVKHHVTEMRNQAKRIVALLNRHPLSY